ncbi:MAG: FISUMP domain-containing protein [bacterium]
MRKNNIILLILLLITIACKKEIEGPTCSIKILDNDLIINHGDSIDIRYSISQGAEHIKERLLFLNDDIIDTIHIPTMKYSLSSENMIKGRYSISLKVTDYNDFSSNAMVEFIIQGLLPSIQTVSVDFTFSDSAILNGKLSSNGGSSTEIGFCYSTNSNPTINDHQVIFNGTLDSLNMFRVSLSPLNKQTKYYARAYAKNSEGINYGEIINFHTSDLTGNFVDERDGKKYGWVKIGSQVWMSENLAWEGGNDGYVVNVGNSEYWNTFLTAYSYLYNDKEKYEKYGIFYQYEAAKLACPEGWHLPKPEDIDILIQFLGKHTAGKKIRSLYGWKDGYNGTNETGFNALPAGFRYNNGTWFHHNEYGCWWMDEESDYFTASQFYVSYDYDSISYYKNGLVKTHGRNVRCLRPNN